MHVQALKYYKNSMDIHAKLDHPVEYADSMNNLGVMLMKKGDYTEAVDLCSKALKVITICTGSRALDWKLWV